MVKFIGPYQEWYTINEAAQYLRVTRRTIYRFIEKGQLPTYRVGVGGHRRFRHKDLERILLDGVLQRRGGVESYAMAETDIS